MTNVFEGSICIRQRIAGNYRLAFFDLLATRCTGGLVLISGQPDPDEAVHTKGNLRHAQWVKIRNVRRGKGVFVNYRQPELIETLDRIKPDVFVTEASPRLVDNRKVIRFLHSRNTPAVGWGLGTSDFWNRPFKRLRKWHRKRMIGQFDGMLCYSTLAAKQYQNIGYQPQNTVVLYNASISRPTDPQPPLRDACVPPYQILFVGGLIPTKSIDRLIEAAALLRDRKVDVVVTIVGDGPSSEPLKALADQLQAPVKFLGRLTGDALAEVGRKADLFVLPGLGGLAIQEAMTWGLPVIVSQADGTELDLVQDNGWIIEKENTVALADCIESAVSDPKRLRDKGNISYQIVRDTINLERMADRFIDALHHFKNQGISKPTSNNR
jgi:glycosyltransferase involved in cell wall biosynthesis